MTDLLDIRRIYVEPAAADLPRGKAVLARFPDAERVEVDGHQRIPELFGDETNVRRWVRIKREALVLGVKKSLSARPNGRSADFIAPSTANGCAMACAYCYVPRPKGYSNPITVFANDLLGWDPRGRTRIRFSLRTGDKGRYVARLTGLIAERAPYCRVRYAF
jgi:spore photoproduct lyase